MSLTDFLFSGTAPPSVTSYGQSVQNVPQWLSDYTQGLVSKANAVAAEPYQPYQGPRIAGFTPDQSASFNLTRQNVGTWQPSMTQAQNLASGAVGAAQPYLQTASQTFNDPTVVQGYMDPYVGNVIDRATQLAMRNYNENVLPGINDQFVRSGQYGSSAHERAAGEAARNLTEGIQGQALGALSQAYGQAGQLFGQDTSRLGTLGIQQGALQNQSAQNLGALSQINQAMGIKDAAALGAIGTQEQQQNQQNLDLAHQDFLTQTQYPKSQVDWLSSVLRGQQVPTATQTTGVQPVPGSTQGQSPLEQLGALANLYAGIKNSARGGVIRFKRGGHVRIADTTDAEFDEIPRGALRALEVA